MNKKHIQSGHVQNSYNTWLFKTTLGMLSFILDQVFKKSFKLVLMGANHVIVLFKPDFIDATCD